MERDAGLRQLNIVILADKAISLAAYFLLITCTHFVETLSRVRRVSTTNNRVLSFDLQRESYLELNSGQEDRSISIFAKVSK